VRGGVFMTAEAAPHASGSCSTGGCSRVNLSRTTWKHSASQVTPETVAVLTSVGITIAGLQLGVLLQYGGAWQTEVA
jgi:hypothetical protein